MKIPLSSTTPAVHQGYDAPANAAQQHNASAGDPPLDDRGLPVGYNLIEDLEIAPRQVKKMMDAQQDFVLIDCRQQSEWDLTHIETARLLPLQQLPHRIKELEDLKHRSIVVHCLAGVRSLKFAHYLKAHGFSHVKSMAGGIDLWNRDIARLRHDR